MLRALMLASVAVTSLALRSPVVVIVSVLTWGFVMWWRRRIRRRRHRWQLEDELVEFVDDLAQELRSGGALSPSFPSVARRHPEVAEHLDTVLQSIAGGTRLDVALDDHSGAGATESVRLLAISVSVLVSVGGVAAPAMERLADTVRAERAQRAEVENQSSQAMASAVVLSVLPMVFVAGVVLVESAAIDFYLRSLAGGFCLVAMAVLLIVGWVWIEALVWPTGESGDRL